MKTPRVIIPSLVVLLVTALSCTKPGSGSELVHTGEPEGVTEISATITGTVRPEGDMQDVMVGFLWSTDSYPDITNSQKVRVTEWKEGMPYSLRLDGLSPATTYYYKAYVQYDGLIHKFGEVKYFTTADVKASISLEDASEIGLYSARLSGSMVIESSERLAQDVYIRLLWEDKALVRQLHVSPEDNGMFSGVFNELKFGTRYCYDVVAKIAGRRFSSEVKSFETLDYQYVAGEAVDLGLSVLWSSTNLGAGSPEEPGAYFSWGETAPKHDYSSQYYQGYQGDAAQALLGDGWRMPTSDETRELLSSTTHSGKTVNGVECLVFSSKIPGKTDQSIILPPSGYFQNDRLFESEGIRFWTSTGATSPRSPSNPRAFAVNIKPGSSPFGIYDTPPEPGLPIRPVKDKPAL